jgi:hypothetical protein
LLPRLFAGLSVNPRRIFFEDRGQVRAMRYDITWRTTQPEHATPELVRELAQPPDRLDLPIRADLLAGAEPVDKPAARSPCRRRAYAAYASWPCLWTHRVASLFWVFAGLLLLAVDPVLPDRGRSSYTL